MVNIRNRIMANCTEIKLGALKRRDSTVKSIIASSDHCILYNFDTAKTKWVRTEIEGNLYLFSRNTSPQFGFTLLNIKNQQNFSQTITKEMGLQLNFPYLLYKNSNGIYAIWFYDKDDSTKMFEVLRDVQQKLIKGNLPKSRKSPPVQKKTQTNVKQNSPESILSILSAADSKHTKTIPMDSSKAIGLHKSPSPTMTTNERTSAFVPLAASRSKSVDGSNPNLNPKNNKNGIIDQFNGIKLDDNHNELHPLLIQMFSKNGENKCQSISDGSGDNDNTSNSLSPSNLSGCDQNGNSLLKNDASCERSPREKIGALNGQSLSAISECDTMPRSLDQSILSESKNCVNSEGHPFVSEESFHALQLMAPSHFLSDEEESGGKSPLKIEENVFTLNGDLSPSQRSSKSSGSSEDVRYNADQPIVKLNSSQMQAALLYLIENDSGFINTLHDAYLKSLTK